MLITKVRPMVIIDNGHGKNTAGKRSPVWADGTQLLEWESNRRIACRLQEELEAAGFDARLLVPEDYDVSLQTRIRRASSLCAEHRQQRGIASQRILLCIHSNAAGMGQADAADGSCASVLMPSGWEAFVHGTNSNTLALATELYRQALDCLPSQFPVRARTGDARRGHACRPKVERFYMLVYAPCPAVLTENLFMDNEQDCHYLMSNKGQEALVNLHLKAVQHYMEDREL